MTQIADLTDRLNRLAKRREDEGIYTDAMIASAAADRIAALEAQLAERVKELRTARGIISNTHKRPVKHAGCVNPYCPICEGGLFVCADCGAAEIETEQRVCTGPALEATPPAPKVPDLEAALVVIQEKYDLRRSTLLSALTAAQETGKP